MKVLHLPFCYFPDAAGGTETYVAALVRELGALGVECAVAAPAAEDSVYEHEGVWVHRFAVNPGGVSLDDLSGAGDRHAATRFHTILDRLRPDVVNLHALTSAVSLRSARAAKAHGAALVFTYHTPTVSCPRGTLLRFGAEICDGELAKAPCTECVLHRRGMNRLSARVASCAPRAAGAALGALGLAGGPWTALRMSQLVALRHRCFKELMEAADRVVAVCEWVRELLERNGVPPEKITVSRQGFGGAPPQDREAPKTERRVPGNPLQIAFLGRFHATKGIGLLVEAILQDRGLPVRLDIFGLAQDGEGERLRAEIEAKFRDDKRIRFREPLPPANVRRTLAGYDALAVPSQWLETGPLVVYEAFAAGIPVVGSDLGGIRELVRHGADGLLVPHASVNAWTASLRRLATEEGLLTRLRSGVRPPRTMREAAEEMSRVYETVLGLSVEQGGRVAVG